MKGNDMTDKPCPFCGEPDPVLDEVDAGIWCIVCDTCGAQGPIRGTLGTMMGEQSPDKAAELWNVRERP